VYGTCATGILWFNILIILNLPAIHFIFILACTSKIIPASFSSSFFPLFPSHGVTGTGQTIRAGCICLKTQVGNCVFAFLIKGCLILIKNQLIFLKKFISGDFVRANGLQEGDFIVIYSDVKCGKYVYTHLHLDFFIYLY
jgi:hypothetical protein